VNQLITKKSIHINLLTETHSAFRVFSFKIVGKIKMRRNDPKVNKVFSTDIESIYAEFEKDD
jgi:hypothetical protein